MKEFPFLIRNFCVHLHPIVNSQSFARLSLNLSLTSLISRYLQKYIIWAVAIATAKKVPPITKLPIDSVGQPDINAPVVHPPPIRAPKVIKAPLPNIVKPLSPILELNAS